MDEFVIAPKEQEWLQAPLSAIHNRKPVQAIVEGKMRDLIVEFLRLREGQPVWRSTVMSLTIAAWFQKKQPHSDVFYRSVGYRYMDPETFLEGKGRSGR
jgi:hypothetical protein